MTEKIWNGEGDGMDMGYDNVLEGWTVGAETLKGGEEASKELTAGSHVAFEKIEILPGENSSIPVGSIIEGDLDKDVKVGESISFSNSKATISAPESFRLVEFKNGSKDMIMRTGTSIYKVYKKH